MSVPTDAERAELLATLQGVEKTVRADLLAQYRADKRLMARARERLADEENSPSDVEAWLQTFAGRGAVLYILKALYVRVLEDQGLLHPIRIRAGGSYELFQRLFPNLGVAAYLRRIFDDASRVFPELFVPTAIEIATPGEASARELWGVWQAAAPGGRPRFDFRGELDTRFIGDLYQDLDPEVKKRYALLQTPRFIEEFILDRTLDPALEKFGLDEFRIIDPTCGSGHFLLGAFERLARAWRARLGDNSSEGRWEAAVSALSAVHGADLNEYACAMSRFRLLLAVVRETGITDAERLRDLHFNVVACDSLIPWEQIVDRPLPGMASYSWLVDYGNDDERVRNEDFFSRGFHAVVGNPPYIAVADKKKRADYRLAWPRSASGKYSLSAPMTERFMLMPVPGGCAGIIVANNFCKRSFGRGLIERVLPEVKLDLIVDTSGAHIPGHGTPTIMLFASRERIVPATHTVQVVAGKHGEPRQPPDPAHGIVWSSIAEHWSKAGYEDRWIAVQRLSQTTFCAHPWSLGSDTIMRIKTLVDAFPRVKNRGAEAGPAAVFAEDEAFARRYERDVQLRSVVIGEDVRDWALKSSGLRVIFPYEPGGAIGEWPKLKHELWFQRTTLKNRGWRGSTISELGLPWWSYGHFAPTRVGLADTLLRIVIAEITTNSHFVFDKSDAVFTQTAPVLTLADADEATYRDVAAILNSSVLEFWFKQVCFDKGNGGINEGIRGDDWEKFYVRNATNVIEAPLARAGSASRLALAELIEGQVAIRAELEPASVIEHATAARILSDLATARTRFEVALETLVALQEELDWLTYRDFGLLNEPPLVELAALQPLARGHRSFEIALARKVAIGEEETSWFERHELTPTTEVPDRYTGDMRSALERRLALIESDETVALLEQPVYKRRWQIEPWEPRVKRAAESWLLDRLEAELRASPLMLSVDELVDRVGTDPKVATVGALAKLDNEVTLADLLNRLLANESIPDNPARLFTATGLSKYVGSQTAYIGASRGVPDAQPFQSGEHVDWKRVWRLQEREDGGETVNVAVPPPFVRTDYAHPNGWKLRSKFNVGNERFIVYDELRPVRYAWGGWTTTERAALSLQAFELRGREPDAAPEKPDEKAPQRCGIQFALWDKIDELRRTGDSLHEEVQTIAQLCGRACPCDVLHEWRTLNSVRRNGRVRTRLVAATEPQSVAPPRQHAIDPDAIERLLVLLRSSGDAGSPMSELEPLFSGNREAARNTLEILRSDGRVEAVGKGRGVRYRLPKAGLF